MTGNKDRGNNFCKEEINKLMLLLRDYPVITCKKTDHTSNKQKDAAWRLLTDKFNSDASCHSTTKQLQQKYNNMKKTARKEMSAEKYGRRQTGGGPAPPKPSETTEWLNTIMGESITGLAAVYDSDAPDVFNIPVTAEGLSVADISDKINLIDSDEQLNTECDPQHKAEMLSIPTVPELEECSKENMMLNNIDAAEKFISHSPFDASTPKSMLRKPVSRELDAQRKRKTAFTSLETRKQIILHTKKRNDLLSSKEAREVFLLNCAKEEHELNMALKREAHEKMFKQQDEIHSSILEKNKLECQIAKLQLNKMSE